ncbi:hypothetical protein XSR1_40029 [Xenorhabdus szentirmaii DSM 16338]|uniref:Uncharacterized protein n=1 Tax=Xenorhabdus szentirmaii DSM 16338 TaxID=1427518 RepID=W1IZT0_9GAMM|nr:hypothetical protein XSR1_40029 [Xenorhabdus szentirmaii DSM 16338]
MSVLVLSAVSDEHLSRQGKYDEKRRFYWLAWYGRLSIDAADDGRTGF